MFTRTMQSIYGLELSVLIWWRYNDLSSSVDVIKYMHTFQNTKVIVDMVVKACFNQFVGCCLCKTCIVYLGKGLGQHWTITLRCLAKFVKMYYWVLVNQVNGNYWAFDLACVCSYCTPCELFIIHSTLLFVITSI